MDDDALIAALQLRAGDAPVDYPPASTEAVASFENATGVRLAPIHARVLTEVANGGFGPGYKLNGLPPGGFLDEDLGCASLVELYLQMLSSADDPWRTPPGLVLLCNWGCATFSYVDTQAPGARVVTGEAANDCVIFHETAPTLDGWLADWARGVELEVHEVIGHRDGINPFTRKPHRFPIRRLRGPRLDFSDRK